MRQNQSLNTLSQSHPTNYFFTLFAFAYYSKQYVTPRPHHTASDHQSSPISFAESITPTRIDGACDSNWSSPKSASGFIFMLANGPVAWFSHTQRTTALSTSEAEWIAAASAAREAIYLRDFAAFVGIPQGPATSIGEDNAGCLRWSEELGQHSKRKHISLSTYFINDLVEAGVVKFKRVPSADNIADVFTKVIKNSVEFKKKIEGFTTCQNFHHFSKLD